MGSIQREMPRHIELVEHFVPTPGPQKGLILTATIMWSDGSQILTSLACHRLMHSTQEVAPELQLECWLTETHLIKYDRAKAQLWVQLPRCRCPRGSGATRGLPEHCVIRRVSNCRPCQQWNPWHVNHAHSTLHSALV